MACDRSALWVLDASVLINLAAMPDPGCILHMADRRCIAPRLSAREVKVLRRPELAHVLASAWVERTVEVVDLTPQELDLFGQLVGDVEPKDIGDGEAAVLAVATFRGGVAILDDGKPLRIAASRIPPLTTHSTVGVLRDLWERQPDARELIVVSLYDALRLARMAVPTEHLEWVAVVLPLETRGSLSSLPRRMRSVGDIARVPR